MKTKTYMVSYKAWCKGHIVKPILDFTQSKGRKMRSMKIGWVIFEKIQSGEVTPGYQAITIYPKANETFESVFKAVFPECTYKGVFESINDASNWVANWRAQ